MSLLPGRSRQGVVGGSLPESRPTPPPARRGSATIRRGAPGLPSANPRVHEVAPYGAPRHGSPLQRSEPRDVPLSVGGVRADRRACAGCVSCPGPSLVSAARTTTPRERAPGAADINIHAQHRKICQVPAAARARSLPHGGEGRGCIPTRGDPRLASPSPDTCSRRGHPPAPGGEGKAWALRLATDDSPEHGPEQSEPARP
jgi:hypothetical protein